LINLILGLAAAYLVICAVASLLQKKLIFRAPPPPHLTAADIDLKCELLTLTSPDGATFVVWTIPAARRRAVAVYFHGNAATVADMIDVYHILYELQVTVYAVEYRGYGGVPGRPSERTLDRDVKTVARFLRNQPEHRHLPVLAIGHSLGGAVATKLAEAYPVDALVLESTFTSMADMARRSFSWLPISLLLNQRFDTIAVVRKLTCPVLLFHSRADQVVPFEQGRRLYQAARGLKRFAEIEGGHNDGPIASESVYRRELSMLIDRLTQKKSTGR
jgi:fermentation-respiration switch protein FrsA (DUF1100 family)